MQWGVFDIREIIQYTGRKMLLADSSAEKGKMTAHTEKKTEVANKRVALTPGTWVALSNIKEPGRTLGETVADLIAEHQRRNLEMDLDEINANGTFTSWEEAKRDLRL